MLREITNGYGTRNFNDMSDEEATESNGDVIKREEAFSKRYANELEKISAKSRRKERELQERKRAVKNGTK